MCNWCCHEVPKPVRARNVKTNRSLPPERLSVFVDGPALCVRERRVRQQMRLGRTAARPVRIAAPRLGSPTGEATPPGRGAAASAAATARPSTSQTRTARRRWMCARLSSAPTCCSGRRRASYDTCHAAYRMHRSAYATRRIPLLVPPVLRGYYQYSRGTPNGGPGLCFRRLQDALAPDPVRCSCDGVQELLRSPIVQPPKPSAPEYAGEISTHEVESRRRCGRGVPGPGADVAGAS